MQTNGPARHLGMYVHTHWGYNHPYAARTWTIEDWEGYLAGLSALGYDFVMIWPLLDCMPADPNDSDVEFLRRIARVIDLGHDRFSMRMVIVAGANSTGNEKAASYAFHERPYFVCEKRADPADPDEVRAFLAARRNQFEFLARADALSIIDSDPGGFSGSTNDQFVALVAGQVDVMREVNPAAEFIYWMWFGWEPYNRFWQETEAGRDAGMDAGAGVNTFREILTGVRDRVAEPWSVYSCRAEHREALESLGLTGKAMHYPYGLIEGEPTFPMTNWTPGALADGLAPGLLAQSPRGAMANSQTHCLQLPHAYAFSHLARGGAQAELDLDAMADDLLPGAGAEVAAAWQAIGAGNPEQQRAAGVVVRAPCGKPHRTGPLTGLLFGDADRFLTDLAMNLELRACLAELTAETQGGTCSPEMLRPVLTVLRPYQRRLGFTDACGGPLLDGLGPALRGLGDARIDRALGDFGEWRDVARRNGALSRLLDAAEAYCGP